MNAQMPIIEQISPGKPQMKRRTFLRGALQLAASAVGGVSLAGMNFIAGAAADPQLTKEQWMDAWLQVAPKAVDGALVMFRFKDPMYVLNRPISWFPNPGQTGFPRVDVPKGFVTDLASIPRVFWSLLRPDGEYAYPAIVHDYLYWTQTTARETADEILKHGMEDFTIDSDIISSIYAGVRVGGASAWADNAQLKLNGEKRVLIKTPDNPLVTWAQWKREPGVFAT